MKSSLHFQIPILMMFFLFISCSFDYSTHIESGPLWGGLAPGDYTIGFRLLHETGRAPTLGEERTVRIGLWYPGKKNGDISSFKFGQYLEQRPEQILNQAFENWASNKDKNSLRRQYFGADADSFATILMETPTAVLPNAQPEDGKFPLIIHVLGRNGHQFESTILWEYLASHGYVVASVAQFGKSLEESSLDFTLEDMQLHLDDLLIAKQKVQALPSVQTDKIGLLGHSSGAIVALWLAVENEDIKAVVGLDGSMNRSHGRELLAAGLKDRRINTPLLNLCRWPNSNFEDDFMSYMDEIALRIRFEKAIHFDFQNWPAYQRIANAEEERSLQVRTVEEASTVFESSAIFSKLMFDAYLKKDKPSKKMLFDKMEIERISESLANLSGSKDSVKTK